MRRCSVFVDDLSVYSSGGFKTLVLAKKVTQR